jgi:hypothetical protein
MLCRNVVPFAVASCLAAQSHFIGSAPNLFVMTASSKTLLRRLEGDQGVGCTVDTQGPRCSLRSFLKWKLDISLRRCRIEPCQLVPGPS